MKERTGTPGRDGDTPDPANIPACEAFPIMDDMPSQRLTSKAHTPAAETDQPDLGLADPPLDNTAPAATAAHPHQATKAFDREPSRVYPSFPPEAPIRAEDLDEHTASGFDLLEKIATLHHRISTLHAEMLEHIAALHDHPCLEPGPRPQAVSEEAERTGRALEGLTRDDTTEAVLIERLLTGKHTTWELIRTAMGLTTRLPRTLQALRDGRLDYRRSVIITKKLQLLGDDHYEAALKTGMSPASAEKVARESVTAVEDDLFEKVSGHTPAQVHRDVDRAIHRIDPGYAKRHAQDAVKGRNVRHRTNSGDATGDIYARLGAPEALAVYNVIDTYARAARQNGAKRSLDELRADAFSHLILHGHLPDGSTPDNLLPINTENATIVKQEGELHPSGPTVGFFGESETSSHPMTFDGNNTADQADATNNTPDRSEPFNRPAKAEPSGNTDGGTARSGNTTAEGVGPAAESETTTQHFNDRNTADVVANGDRRSSTTRLRPGSAGISDAGRLNIGDNPASAHRPKSGVYGRSGPRTHVHITVSLETLMGMNDDAADLAGHGPITADTARDLAFNAGSTWRRLVTDPLSGQLLDYGRKTYRPPVGLADFVKARDVTCRMPSCDRPTDACDLDHVLSWPAGTTSERNLESKCEHHHTLKHQGRWKHQLSTDPDHPPGTIIMVSPTGHVYLSYPYTYPQSISKTVAQNPPTPGQGVPSGAEPPPGDNLKADADDLPPF